MNDRWQEIKRILADALDLPEEGREAFVAKVCAGDSQLYREVMDRITAFRNPPAILREGAVYPLVQGPRTIQLGQLKGRWEIKEPLGSGGSGATVYKAYDRERRKHVALKILEGSEESMRMRLRSEFRIVRDISHRNLVELHDLYSDNELSCIAMELITGVRFVQYVRDGLPMHACCDLQRLMPVLTQLCQGVIALHGAHRVHRDLKPGNVLVTDEPCVKIIDFGAVRDLLSMDGGRTVIFTQLYGAPEQQPPQVGTVAEPADWFAVGVMLYQTLTGSLPWSKEQRELLSLPAPPHVLELTPMVPKDLAELCMSLLHPNPGDRPTGAQILECIRNIAGNPVGASVDAPPAVDPFIGREKQLSTLSALFEHTLDGNAAVAHVLGKSGLGKTTLVQKFIRDVAANVPNLIVLQGRCHTSEIVQFRTLNEVIDCLTKALRQMSVREVEVVLPRESEMQLACRLFNALEEFCQVKHGGTSPDTSESQDSRKRGFLALLDLLGRVCTRSRPLIIWIDDLQWGDMDSVAFFREFVGAISPVSMFLIVSYRSEDVPSSSILDEYRKALTPVNDAIRVADIEIEELNLEECGLLARQILSFTGLSDSEIAEVASEAVGNPFFLQRIVQDLISNTQHADGRSGLAQVIRSQVDDLTPAARRLVDIVCIAGQPVLEEVAKAATGYPADWVSIVETLQKGRLLRIYDDAGNRKVETVHDKIREVVSASLGEEERATLHASLAAKLRERPSPDPAVLAFHYQRARIERETAVFALQAGDQAASALAFDQAARFYRQVLAVNVVVDGIDRSEVNQKLGKVLAAAGRGVEAALAYAEAATAETPKQTECLRIAADQYLRSGHIKQGILMLRQLADTFDIRLVSGGWQAVGILVLQRAALRIRMRWFKNPTRPASQIAPSELARLDGYWSLVQGFVMVDPVLGSLYHSKHLMLALRVGEPYRVGMSKALEVGFSIVSGERELLRVERISQECLKLGQSLNQPYLTALSLTTQATSGIMTGQWRKAAERGSAAVGIFSRECSGVAWELATARTFWFSGLGYLGEWKKFAELLSIAVQDARDRGDQFALTHLVLTTPSTWAMLIADTPDKSEAHIREVLEKWTMQSEHQLVDIQQAFGIIHLVDIALYRGEARQAWIEIEQGLPRLKRLFRIVRSQLLVILSSQSRARAALYLAGTLSSGEEQKALITESLKCARVIRRQKTSWADPFAVLIEASAATIQGSADTCLALLEIAEAGFNKAGMKMHAAATRYRRGELTAGAQGKSLVEGVLSFMADEGVSNPVRIINMLAPGRWQTA